MIRAAEVKEKEKESETSSNNEEEISAKKESSGETSIGKHPYRWLSSWSSQSHCSPFLRILSLNYVYHYMHRLCDKQEREGRKKAYLDREATCNRCDYPFM